MLTVEEAQVPMEQPQTSEPPKTLEPPKTPTDKNATKKKSKKVDKNSTARFEGAGVIFKGKIIGIEDVPEARGDVMCQQAMQRLKAAVLQAGAHKQRIIINVSMAGLQIFDEKTQAVNHRHPVHKISFISRDVTDNRAFGYIFGTPDGKHQFFAIKTEKAAEQLVLSLRDLFQCVFEKKKKEMEEAKKQEENKENQGNADNTYDVPLNNAPVNQTEGDTTYQVPNNNAPVEPEKTTFGNLLDLEADLQTLQQGIAQMDAFGDSFFTAPAPQTTSPGAPAAPAVDPWGSSQSQTAPQVATNVAFPSTTLPAGQPQPTMTVQNQFTNASNPFSGSGANTFSQNQSAPVGFDAFGTPSTTPANAFAPPRGNAQSDPFSNDPFFTTTSTPPTVPANSVPDPNVDKYSVFQELSTVSLNPPATQTNQIDPNNIFFQTSGAGVLEPVQLQKTEADNKPKAGLFDDLCDIGTSNRDKKDMFSELKTTPKKTLQELRGNASNPIPTPESDPFSFPPGLITTQQQPVASATLNPFDASVPSAVDPFAAFGGTQSQAQPSVSSNDPFASFMPPTSSQVQPVPSQSDEFNLPFPNAPPPPIPANAQLNMFESAPAPPPRPVGTGLGLLEGPPSAKPRQSSGEAPVPRPRTTIQQIPSQGIANGNDPFAVFETPPGGASQAQNPFGAGIGFNQQEEPLYATVNKPKKP